MSDQSVKIYRIHPGIGIARVGNSTVDDFFLGPEVPDFRFTPDRDGNYRNGRAFGERIRRQGARFRIYEHTYRTPGDKAPLVREITDREAEIEWHVHLANLKSHWEQERFPNNPGRKTLRRGQRVEVHGKVDRVAVQLGTLLGEPDGQLVVLGGFGRSGPFHAEAKDPDHLHNQGWYDDAADGPVGATITLRETGETVAVEPAWVITSVPAYAAAVHCVVTLYDLAYDIAVKKGLLPHEEVSFLRDVYPVLFRTAMAFWVSEAGRYGHGPGKPGHFLAPELFAKLQSNAPEFLEIRRAVFGRLRPPKGNAGPKQNMPKLEGPLTLTETQYEQLRKWSEGQFVPDWPVGHMPQDPPRHRPFSELTPREQTEALDRAGLETGTGGYFQPGIEVGSVFADPEIHGAPLRLLPGLRPGTLTSQLSVPWQSDFNACKETWWPSARPDEVTADGETFYSWVKGTHRDMVERWWELGFLHARQNAAGDTVYVEAERLLGIPSGVSLVEQPAEDTEREAEEAAAADVFAAGLVAQATAAPVDLQP